MLAAGGLRSGERQQSVHARARRAGHAASWRKATMMALLCAEAASIAVAAEQQQQQHGSAAA